MTQQRKSDVRFVLECLFQQKTYLEQKKRGQASD